MRGPHRQERIPLFTALLTPGLTDANLFTQKLIQMCKDNPDLTKGLRAVAYDMALRSADSDRLMDHGILPITKTPRTSRGKTAAVNLGPHPFKTATGQAETNIVALNGTPNIAVMDGEGNPHYQPLRRILTQIKKTGPRTRKHIVQATQTSWSTAFCSLSAGQTRSINVVRPVAGDPALKATR